MMDKINVKNMDMVDVLMMTMMSLECTTKSDLQRAMMSVDKHIGRLTFDVLKFGNSSQTDEIKLEAARYYFNRLSALKDQVEELAFCTFEDIEAFKGKGPDIDVFEGDTCKVMIHVDRKRRLIGSEILKR